jgi:hypothetical protein
MNDAGDPYELRIGVHTFRFEPPELYLATLTGDVELPDMTEMLNAVSQFGEGKRRIFGIVDVSRVGSVSLPARKASTQIPRNILGLAILGGSFRLRLIISLLNKANSLLRREAPGLLAFFGTEAEARAWIDDYRANHPAGSPEA